MGRLFTFTQEFISLQTFAFVLNFTDVQPTVKSKELLGSPSYELVRPFTGLTLANGGNRQAKAVIQRCLPAICYNTMVVCVSLSHLCFAIDCYGVTSNIGGA